MDDGLCGGGLNWLWNGGTKLGRWDVRIWKLLENT